MYQDVFLLKVHVVIIEPAVACLARLSEGRKRLSATARRGRKRRIATLRKINRRMVRLEVAAR